MKKESRKLDELRAKAGLYGLLSTALQEPKPVIASRDKFDTFLHFVSGGEGIPRPPEAPEDAGTELRAVFGHNLSPDCPPFQTQYGKVDVFRQTSVLADLAGFYRAFGVDISGTNRRSDYLPVQLEFASLLCHKEARARENGEADNAEISCGARTRFLDRHLVRWVAAFAGAVIRKGGSDYYSGLARTLAAFVRADAESLGVDPDSEPRPDIRMEKPEDPCATCFGGIDDVPQNA